MVKSVTAVLKWKVSTAASIASLKVTDYNNEDTIAVAAGTATDATEPLADKTTVLVFSSAPSFTDVNTAGRLGVLIEAIQGASATAVTYSLDYVALSIEYEAAGINDLAALHADLEVALRDTTNQVWSDAELDTLLTYACSRLFPKIARRMTEAVTLVDDTEVYPLSDLIEVNRIDVLDDNGKLVYFVSSGSWEYRGDGVQPVGDLFLNSTYSHTGWSLLVHGWGRYDLVTHLPPYDYRSLIIALARAEATRREIARRANFKGWQAENQVQNISVNELVEMQHEATSEAMRLFGELKTRRRPVPAYVGP